MKRTWLYYLALIAMSFSFITPAQAAEGWEGFSPAAEFAYLADIGAGSGDDKVTTCRCMKSQLEAAELHLETKTTYALIGGGSSNALWPDGSGAVHEVGWRS